MCGQRREHRHVGREDGMSLGMCACTCLRGVMDESRTLPNIPCLYIYLNAWWHPKGLQHVCVCVFMSVEGEECPARAQLSKHVPFSCLPAPVREITAWIYLSIYFTAPQSIISRCVVVYGNAPLWSLLNWKNVCQATK